MSRRACVLLLVGCAGQETPPPTPSPAPAPSPAPVSALSPVSDPPPATPKPHACPGPAEPQTVHLKTSDGHHVEGTFVNPCRVDRPVVVLAHQMCRDRNEWGEWTKALHAKNIATLAIDLRGHGKSKEFADGKSFDLCSEGKNPAVQGRYAGMVEDVKAALVEARSRAGGQKVAVVGSSIGANSALVAFGGDAQVAAVVALSPGLDYRGIKPEAAVAGAGSRTVVLLAAEGDKRSADAVRQLAKKNAAARTKVFPEGAHGNSMLEQHPEELSALVELLESQLAEKIR